MSEVNFERMLEICNKFVDGNPIDFYQLFELDKEMNLMELKKDIKNKRIRVMFHPDQLGIVPDEYKATFQKICDSIPELDNVFYSKENRSKYDQELEAAKEKADETIQEEPETVEITSEDKSKLEQAIIQTANKYGWEHMVKSLVEVILNNNAVRFTRDGNARDMINELGQEKIRDIVLSASYNDIDANADLSAEQIAANYITEIFRTNQVLRTSADALTEALDQTATKYSWSHAYVAMKNYVELDDPNWITGKENARKNLVTYVNPRDVRAMLMFINNGFRFNSPVNLYTNTKNQDIQYQLGIARFNEQWRKPQQNQEYHNPSFR